MFLSQFHMADEISTTAETNVESDICYTVPNAVKVVVSVRRPEVFFVPDKYSANYVSTKAEKKLFHETASVRFMLKVW